MSNLTNSLPMREGRGGSTSSVIGIGETVLDIIFRDDQPQRAVPGGSTFNAMITLGRVLSNPNNLTTSEPHNLKTLMVTETGDDHIGQIITDFMRANHVSTDLVTINAGTQSHLSLAFLDSERNAQYEFYKDHASARLDAAKTDASDAFRQHLSPDTLILFGSFFAVNPALRHHTLPMLQAAHQAGATLYYDINFRRSHIKDIPDIIGNLEENIRLSTVVRGSAEDFGYLYGTTDPRQVYLRHIRPLCPRFICTDGPHATHLFAPNSANPDTFVEAEIPVPPVADVVSTIGAGDNFNAGFLYSVIRDGLSHQDLLSPDLSVWFRLIETAQRFSAHVCQRMDNYVDPDFMP